MADKKRLEDIRPARGVKIKKKQRPKVEVVENVKPDVPPEQIEPPTEEAARHINELREAKVDLVDAMKNFNALLNIKVLPENKSQEDKTKEENAIRQLIVNSQKLENLVGDHSAILGLCVFAIRQSLSLRDAGNKLAHKVEVLSKKVEQIEAAIYEEDEQD